jgi:hypothetical protein|tara:strand:+ start:119 stop:484 length:366 start_codon:yes stop_codon:yes gene_type:complete
MSERVFNSTYDLLNHFCSLGRVEIRFYQKHSSELYPEFYFGDKKIHEELHVPIWLWFTDGDGEIPWTRVSLVFDNEYDELVFDFEDCNIDEEYYPDWDDEVDEYLLDVEKLKDNKKYILKD